MLRKKILITGLLLLGLASPIVAYAQTTTDEDSSVKDFELKLVEGTQSPINGSVPMTFTVKTDFDSERAFIRWDSTPTLEFLEPKEVYLSVFKGKTYEFKQRVKVKEEGVYRINADIEIWRADQKNTLESEQIDIAFNDSLQRIPVTEEFKSAQLIWTIVKIVLFVASIIFAIIIIRLVIKRFKQWMARD